jgi:hypothetical protein
MCAELSKTMIKLYSLYPSLDLATEEYNRPIDLKKYYETPRLVMCNLFICTGLKAQYLSLYHEHHMFPYIRCTILFQWGHSNHTSSNRKQDNLKRICSNSRSKSCYIQSRTPFFYNVNSNSSRNDHKMSS